MSFAPLYPIKTWGCEICGSTNPGDIGFCPSCRGGHLERGGLYNGEEPYFPVWHAEKAGFDVSQGI